MRRLILLALLGLLAGCGSTPSGPAPHPADLPPTPRERAAEREAAKRPPAPRCPANAGNCRTGAGRVLALESVDPDGDGDLHLVLASSDSITLPGITVLDVNKDLRPKVDPRVGDWAAGAGPVYPGSHSQHQIQVERIVVWPRR